MGKFIKNLAILATIATMTSSAMAYNIQFQENKSDSSTEWWSGRCDDGQGFHTWRGYDESIWHASGPKGKDWGPSRDAVIRKVCGE